MGTPTKTQTVIDLVHHLDELNAHRSKVLVELDAEISATMRELAKLTGEAPTRGTNSNSAKPEPVAAPSTAKELELVMVQVVPKKASFADLALAALKKDPKTPTAELARMLYGDDSAKARDKARAVLYFLEKKAERIRRMPSDDGWEVITG
jgi:hypothetical protein